MKRASTPALRRPEDAASVVFSALVLLCYGTAFAFMALPGWSGLEGFSQRMTFVVGVGFLLGLVGGLNATFNLHNHFHLPFFRSEKHNLWFGRLSALAAGWPWILWSHVHREHHDHLATDDSWTTPRRKADGRFEGLITFVLFRWHWRLFTNLKQDWKSGHVADASLLQKETRVFALLYAAPFLLGPWVGLGLWLFPHFVANFFVAATMTYVMHVGKKGNGDPRLTLANSFDSPLFNRLCFNAGFAATHHAHPEVHWSELPTVHAEDHERMIEQGTHVLPYGPFHASDVLGVLIGKGDAQEEFDRTQARDFGTPLCLRITHEDSDVLPAEPQSPAEASDSEERSSSPAASQKAA